MQAKKCLTKLFFYFCSHNFVNCILKAKMEIAGPPSDPGDIYYLKVCYVCGEIAKPGQTHLRNYGGIVCLGCRQFFRRMHQNEKVNLTTFCLRSIRKGRNS
jgi:hypothetical protein